MKKKSLIIGIGILFFIFSCKKDGENSCPISAGEETTEIRKVSDFHSIKMSDKFDVYFLQSKDSSYALEIQAGENIIPNIITEKDGDYLIIRNEIKCNFLRSYKNKIKIIIKSPHLKNIINDGVGNFYSLDTIIEEKMDYYIQNSGDIELKVKTKRILGHMHGAGDIYLSGFADNHLVNSVGQSFIRAQDLITGYSEVHFRSSGEARISVSGLLDVRILASGNVYYGGNPASVIFDKSGTGNLIKL